MDTTPYYRVLSSDGATSVIAIQLPDFREAQTTIATRMLGTPAGDAMIRSIVDARLSTQDVLRGEI